MPASESHINASLITLAWPDTKVRRIGVWYDQITRWLGFIKRDYYKAGHAATVLVNHVTGKLTYFDFGRYHTPEKMGRLRSENTDPELKLRCRAILDDKGEICNLNSILVELSLHPATHGDGEMHASVVGNIQYDKVSEWTRSLQGLGLVHYGPFDTRGTNCSRFVRDIVKIGTSEWLSKLKLSLPWMITPATKWIVRNASSDGLFYVVNSGLVQQRSVSMLQRLDDRLSSILFNRGTELRSVSSLNTCEDGRC